MNATRTVEESRFREIFRAAHAFHARCIDDEWLTEPCAGPDGRRLDRPVVWSRRNGAWHRVEILWVGAAPGNAGGRGAGELGAHGTRIPFGGDVAGANLEVLFSSIGLNRNETFITAVLNQLPARGGGEPTPAEIAAPVGRFPTSLHLLRATILAAGPRLIVALGTLALRATIAAAQLDDVSLSSNGGQNGSAVSSGRGAPPDRRRVRLPGQPRLEAAGLVRGVVASWPEGPLAPSSAFLRVWREAWPDSPLPQLLWLLHPSAQNMSPFAGRSTAFYRRMIETRDALVNGVSRVFGRSPPAVRPEPPETGIYALPEWRRLIAPRLAAMDRLWREKGV